MKSHFCKSEGTTLLYEGECNWCGEKEMTKLEQAARQALEALQNAIVVTTDGNVGFIKQAITALREALAEQGVRNDL